MEEGLVEVEDSLAAVGGKSQECHMKMAAVTHC